MDKAFVKGRSVDEKFNSIDIVLKHFSRRLGHKVVGLVPAAPVFDFVYTPDTYGVILRRIFPAKGVITKACVYIAHYEGRGSTVIEIEIVRDGKSIIEEFEVRSGRSLLLDLNLIVEPGDLFLLSAREWEKVKGIWIGFLYEIDIGGLGRKEFVFDQLEEFVKEDEDAR